jgi:AmmeMemoRadiSam system protein B
MSKLRPPVRAGSFYPASAAELRQTIARYLARVEPTELTGDLLGLICPHAGYVYSGQTAAHAYALARRAVEQDGPFDLVVVLSPAHFMGAGRFSVSEANAYQTPLGTVEIDQRAVEALGQRLRIHRMGFDGEHAIEVQLPFLQSTLGEFTLLPVMIGDAALEAGEELGDALHDILAGKRALIVASSDMHHINNYDQVTHRDRAVIEALASLDLAQVKQVLSRRDCTVCGRVAIYAMLGATMAAGADHVDILHYTNSGDVTGRRSPGEYTVGYLAAAVLRET